ncbi:MAG: hypothetical protein PHP62_02795 [Candidatus Moranbacteria bacterium]|nr:hypothetical protein [Candidatus Moranbacteria bacterium]
MSEYHGRIMPFQKFKEGALTIEVPLEDALKWGQGAIMIYNEKELHVWRPDNEIAGIFQHASIVTKHIHNHMHMWKIKVEKNEVTLNTHYPFGWVSMWCVIWSALALMLWGPTFKERSA